MKQMNQMKLIALQWGMMLNPMKSSIIEKCRNGERKLVLVTLLMIIISRPPKRAIGVA